jgi:hypothetical protein
MKYPLTHYTELKQFLCKQNKIFKLMFLTTPIIGLNLTTISGVILSFLTQSLG